jgi:DNA-binding NtrC family response regulator
LRTTASQFGLLRFALLHFIDSHSNSNFGEGIVNLDGQLQEIIDELLAHGISLELAKKEFEKKYIVGAVKRSSGNLGRAASSLGIHRNTLRNKVGILNIRLPREKFRVSPDITKKK